ncbi:MAG: hypothetical protein O3A80_05325 [bacterium]|nr:hypothetical protein [bacterium]MDA1292987.1 hypothetical protein [bacterium]
MFIKITALLLLAAIPTSAFAGVDLVIMATLEMECRQEMGLVGMEVQPGITKANLRRCIRLKNSQSRTRTETRRRTITDEIQEQEIQENSISLRMQYNLDCREKLGIGATDVVQPGPRLESLKRCTERMTSETSRIDSLRQRRSTVIKRSRALGTELKKRTEAELNTEIRKLDTDQRTRLQTQILANPQELKQIRESYRVRSFFTNDPVQTRATQKQEAQNCRQVPAKEWGKCIREALQK